MNHDEILSHNRRSWDMNVARGNRWTSPVSTAVIERARRGDFSIVLTPTKPVPRSWFPPLAKLRILCLASAGGQQAPVLAAAGGNVTVLDNSPRQIDQDRKVARRENLNMDYVHGDMADLSMFENDAFDLIFHPCSNTFVPDVLPVWRECYRVLRSGGVLMAGFTNAVRYIFDDERKENGNLEVRYPLPYSDLDYLSERHIQAAIQSGKSLEFGHTLSDQIGGQLKSGFLLNDMYEDRYSDRDEDPLSNFLDTFIATRAIKP